MNHIQGEYHSRHAWDDDCDDFDQQLEKLGVNTVTKKKVPDIIREFRTYIKDWDIDHLN